MKFSLPLLIIGGVALATTAHATTITFGGVPTSRPIQDSLGTTFNNTNSVVLMGTFANESFTLNQNLSLQDNVSAIQSTGLWEQFGYDTLTGTLNGGVANSLQINASGKVAGTVTDNNAGPTKANFFNNKNLYLWVFNASSISGATEMGIFRASSATVPWTFPTNAGGVGDTATLSTSLTGAAVINVIGGVGSIGPSNQLRTVGVTPIPEPSTMTFGVVGILAALSTRKRKRQG